jgi:hypothetical protein
MEGGAIERLKRRRRRPGGRIKEEDASSSCHQFLAEKYASMSTSAVKNTLRRLFQSMQQSM